MSEYTIVFEQGEKWDERSRSVILQAADLLGRQFSRYTGLDPVTSFNRVFGTVKVRFNPTLATLAKAGFGAILFRHNEAVDLALTVHEFGHLFGVRAKNQPTKQIWADKVNVLACSVWPGCHPPTLANYNYVEKFCNLLEAWMLGLFALTETGVLCDEWMEQYMPGWVAVAMERKP